ncbi:MAG: glutaredoxin family protein [Acidobacteria bacterium]|nr:glutaredoxin family protein [Acidobacteriota bacterium]
MPKLILYGRRNCHLCEVAKEAVKRLQRRLDFDVEERDVDDHPDWVRRFGDEVPVGMIGDRKVFKFRVDQGKLEHALLADR